MTILIIFSFLLQEFLHVRSVGLSGFSSVIDFVVQDILLEHFQVDHNKGLIEISSNWFAIFCKQNYHLNFKYIFFENLDNLFHEFSTTNYLYPNIRKFTFTTSLIWRPIFVRGGVIKLDTFEFYYENYLVPDPKQIL